MSDDIGGQPLSVDEAQAISETVLEEIADNVVVSETFLHNLLTGALAQQHVLIEDVPGTGKTLTARSLAAALGLEFSRIQFTPDLLPSDITGSMVFNEKDGSFEFRKGPIFSNIVLADEVNRAPPKTQAAMLEIMEEKQVSVGETTHSLPEPFFVIATQNPIEQEGTFELPESQRDRFIIKTSLGYPDRASEQELLDRRLQRRSPTPSIEQVIEPAHFETLQAVAEYIHVAPEIRDYIIDIGRKTREHNGVEIGVSPRGIQRLLEATRARAIIDGREFVVPDDVKTLAVPVFAHRLVLSSTSMIEQTTRQEIVEAVLEETAVPAMESVQPDQ